MFKGEEKKDKMDTSNNQPASIIKDPKFPLATSINKELDGLEPTAFCICIYRVPPTLRQVNEKFYTPQIVSIGPFHYQKEEVGPWKEHKLRYLQAFLDRTEKSLEDCIEFVKGWEKSARNCSLWGEIIALTSDEFVHMMLLDSCFIIEVMWRAVYDREIPIDYLSWPDLIFTVRREMILLENQIPFFVLHGLFNFCFSKLGDQFFIELSIKYFSDLLLTETKEGDTFKKVKRHQESGFEIEHLTDLLRICHLPTDLQTPNMGKFVPIPTAARLHEAGMKFKIGESKRLLDMQYNTTGLLEMPKFKVDDNSYNTTQNVCSKTLLRWRRVTIHLIVT